MPLSTIPRILVSRAPSLRRRGGAAFADASIYMDFIGGEYVGFQPGNLTQTRATIGYAQWADGTWVQYPINALRKTDQGVMREEARTNSIRNNSMQGAVAGSPGTLPTNWTMGTVTGITPSVVGTGTELGVEYIDVRWAGTNTSGADGYPSMAFEAGAVAAASSGQIWTLSAFFKVSAGSVTNVAGPVLQIQEWDSSPGFLRGTNAVSTTLTSTLTRFSGPVTAGASAASVRPFFAFTVSDGQAIDITLRIGWPQLELGAFATTPIRTTSAAATRNADNAYNVSLSGYGTNVTVFAEGTSFAPSTAPNAQTIICLSDGTSNNRVSVLRTNSTLAMANNVAIAGVTQTSPTTSVVATGSLVKAAAAFGVNDNAVSVNGGAAVVTNSNGYPSITTMDVGARAGNTTAWNGWIRRIAVFPLRLSDAKLQELTS